MRTDSKNAKSYANCDCEIEQQTIVSAWNAPDGLAGVVLTPGGDTICLDALCLALVECTACGHRRVTGLNYADDFRPFDEQIGFIGVMRLDDALRVYPDALREVAQ